MKAPSTWIAWAGFIAGAVLVGSPSARGQYRTDWIYRPLFRYAEGKVLLDGQNVALEPGKSFLFDGQVLGTAEGRAQTLLGRAFQRETTVFLAEKSSLKILYGELPDQTLEVLSGSAIIECNLPSKEPASSLSVRYKGITIYLNKKGEYRIDAELGRLRVLDGEATVNYGFSLDCAKGPGCVWVVGRGPTKTAQVRKGEQFSLDEDLPASAFDIKDTDAFYHWVRRRLSAPPAY